MGSTTAGRTGWHPWIYAPFSPVDQALDVMIDTSEAGFTQTPTYFATLQGDFNIRDEAQPDLWPEDEPAVLSIDTAGFVMDATARGFTYRVFFPMNAQEAEERGWIVHWIGFQAATNPVNNHGA
jgi:hypothetical protein